jgi:Family of unknown function (DUF6510)
MDPLDGNAIGGLLLDVFGAEMTDARGRCEHCGTIAVVAECEVFLGGPGVVVRCRTCHDLLMVFVQARETMCVDLSGLGSLDRPPTRFAGSR